MSISDSDNRYISDIVYTIDELHPKYNPDIKESAIVDINGSDYEILKVHNNSDGNGMQEMAVAPIDSKTGKVDITQVVITYAGTDFSDDLDVYSAY